MSDGAMGRDEQLAMEREADRLAREHSLEESEQAADRRAAAAREQYERGQAVAREYNRRLNEEAREHNARQHAESLAEYRRIGAALERIAAALESLP